MAERMKCHHIIMMCWTEKYDSSVHVGYKGIKCKKNAATAIEKRLTLYVWIHKADKVTNNEQ